MDILKKDEYFMKKALFQAEKAFKMGEVPVGAVLVYRETVVIATAFNQREIRKNPLAHAELIGIEKACKLMGRWRLDDISLYVTLEPCPMCAGAAVQARIKRLVFGATDPKAGAITSLMNIPGDKRLNHRIETLGGVLEEECSFILKEFFKQLRINKKVYN
ncbi:MAG: tRNA adenosine(34) deaminase TadA [Candidatus Eremiobacterota bacterium]